MDQVDDAVRTAMGLVEDASYQELFSRYIIHVTHFVRNEKLRSPITGGLVDPDSALMGDVEKVLGVKEKHEAFRHGIMTKIGAWSVDHAGEKPDYPIIFPDYFERLSSSYYEQHRQRVVRILRDALSVLSGEEGGLPQERVKPAEAMLERLESDEGYCKHCSREAITLLVRRRYTD